VANQGRRWPGYKQVIGPSLILEHGSAAKVPWP
jgi:hypothetical protein